MKPDAWRFSFPTSDKWHLTEVPPNSHSRPNLTWEPLYSAATIRKWLEEVSETVIAAGTLHDTMDDLSDIGADAEGIYRAMIAAKLQSLEGGE